MNDPFLRRPLLRCQQPGQSIAAFDAIAARSVAPRKFMAGIRNSRCPTFAVDLPADLLPCVAGAAEVAPIAQCTNALDGIAQKIVPKLFNQLPSTQEYPRGVVRILLKSCCTQPQLGG
jgi:hypothetical protein